jgi:hypothetical protein
MAMRLDGPARVGTGGQSHSLGDVATGVATRTDTGGRARRVGLRSVNEMDAPDLLQTTVQRIPKLRVARSSRAGVAGIRE